MSEAVVVGSGPNGLAAAVALALRGVSVTVLEAAGEIGGGARSGELDVPGVVHDHCSAAHPTGVGSPFLRMLPLERYGLRWRWPEVDLAHPLDDGSAGVMLRSVADTAALLGADGGSWRALFEPLAADFDAVAAEIMRPVTHLPAHPVALARFGLRAVQPATVLARRWRTAQARALFAGTAAHAFRPLHSPVSAAIGVMMTAAGHRYGWPVAEGGSGAVTGALARMLRAHGGRIETGVRVRSGGAARGGGGAAGRVTAGGRGAGRGPVAGAGAARLRAVPACSGGVQGGPGRGGRGAVAQRALPARRVRPRGRDAGGGRPRRAGGRAGTHAGAAGRAGGPAVPGRSRPLPR
ncbi:NAD(P)/FAD-dependent oxidoreductase [Saccharopolyspora erythraea]|uniref:phytoene desaturase family protein n=1 Tax=Saccharopolyspora erythraea TaxID=1836 RepID=UPI0002EF39B6